MPEARLRLMAYHWPGNVNELINLVEREAHDLPDSLSAAEPACPARLRASMTIEEMEQVLIVKTLEATGGNRTQAAEMLGITRKILQNKIKEYSPPPTE